MEESISKSLSLEEVDLGTYARVNESLAGSREILTKLRSCYGSIGFSGQNSVSDLSKEIIQLAVKKDKENGRKIEEDIAYVQHNLDKVLEGLKEQNLPSELEQVLAPGFAHAIQNFSNFFRTSAQERVESHLFVLVWPVIEGSVQEMPKLPTVRDFNVNIQAVLAGYIDLVSELGKAMSKKLENPGLSADEHLVLFERFLKVARSIHAYLSSLRHFPGYVISNGFGRYDSFQNRLYRISGLIGRIGNDYSFRLYLKNLIAASHRCSK